MTNVSLLSARMVSTHSRLKAAAPRKAMAETFGSFNTQPPEGGWSGYAEQQHQCQRVSTHSRLKAADVQLTDLIWDGSVSTHSRLKAADVIPRNTFGVLWFQHTAA